MGVSKEIEELRRKLSRIEYLRTKNKNTVIEAEQLLDKEREHMIDLMGALKQTKNSEALELFYKATKNLNNKLALSGLTFFDHKLATQEELLHRKLDYLYSMNETIKGVLKNAST